MQTQYRNWTECWAEVSCPVLSFWSAEIRGSENQPCYCKCVRAVGIGKDVLHFRRGIADSDQIECKSDGNIFRSDEVAM